MLEKIKILDNEFEIVNINQRSNLLEIEFPVLRDLNGMNLEKIEVLTAGGISCAILNDYTTIYRAYGNVVILSDNGAVYEEPVVIDPPIPLEPHVPTEEEIAAQLESAKKNKINKSKTMLEDYLQNNPMLFTDGKFYAITRDKQNLLNNAISIWQMKTQIGDLSAAVKWNATGEECVEWAAEDITILALSIAAHVEPFIAKQQALEVVINDCTTLEDLAKVVISY